MAPPSKCQSGNVFELNHCGGFTLSYLHDLEGAVGCVQELELLDGPLRNRVVGGSAPAPLHQADGLCCKHPTQKMTD